MVSWTVVGFDSAWTPGNSGAIAGILHESSGRLREFEDPRVVNYAQAERVINEWQERFRPNRTIILLDQPTIVANEIGQRPVESVVSPSVSLRLGGMQPASRSRVEMFGATAPIWAFLRRFGGAADPFQLAGGTQVIETYPVLALIALKWLRDAPQSSSRPKILLVSDGRTSPADAERARAAIATGGVELSVVAIGSNADHTLLQQLADSTGGKAYFPSDLADLPRIVGREAARSSGGKPNRRRPPVKCWPDSTSGSAKTCREGTSQQSSSAGSTLIPTGCTTPMRAIHRPS